MKYAIKSLLLITILVLIGCGGKDEKKEKEQIKKDEFIKNFKETKLYKDVIEKFPDANLVDVISKKEKEE